MNDRRPQTLAGTDAWRVAALITHVRDTPGLSFDPASLTHVGHVVTDLDRAISELTDSLGCSWNTVLEWEMRLRIGTDAVATPVRFTYSAGDGPHIELLEGPSGSYWGPQVVGLHHVGYWTDDLVTDSAVLEASGTAMEATIASRKTTGPVQFCYHRTPVGIRVELVAAELKPAFQRWFETGRFE